MRVEGQVAGGGMRAPSGVPQVSRVHATDRGWDLAVHG